MKPLLITTIILFLISCGPDDGPNFPTDTGQSSSSYRYYASSSSTYYNPNVPNPNDCSSGEQKITSNTFSDGRCNTESKAFADKWLGLCASTNFIACVNEWKCSGGPAVSKACGNY